jgi:serine/threonine protein kinase
MCCPAGTIVYMPKELLLSGRMTQATDIYSFGLMSEYNICCAVQHHCRTSPAAVCFFFLLPMLCTCVLLCQHGLGPQ